jgi:23S rRNA (uracil1939-C5)-methyltransferase
MSKIKKNYLLEGLEVVDISTEGKAIAKHEGLVVFIEGGVPGDKIDAMVYRSKSNFAEARIEKITTFSEHRVNALCEHFGVCGGCKWQNLSYDQQLHFKRKYVLDAFRRIGKLEFPEVEPTVGNLETYYYRNKLEYSFSNKRWLSPDEMADRENVAQHNGLGYHIAGMFDKVLDIRNCYLQPEPGNSIRKAIKQYALEKNLSFYDIRNRSGFLRTLMIRLTSTGEVMVLISVFEYKEKELNDLMDFLMKSFPSIISLQYTHNNKGNDSLDGLEIRTYAGKDYITEEMEDLKFRISAKSFYQTNSQQAYNLYSITREFADLSGNETVYDLYTGTGTIANFVARSAKKVIGVEYVEDAIRDAKANSALNGISNTSFFAGDLKDVLNEEFIAKHGKPDVIITDPPRAGMHEDVVKAIVSASPERIVYVSCNPSTQARDLALMSEVYEIVKVQPVDMFPQTAHVENVALLRKRVKA